MKVAIWSVGVFALLMGVVCIVLWWIWPHSGYLMAKNVAELDNWYGGFFYFGWMYVVMVWLGIGLIFLLFQLIMMFLGGVERGGKRVLTALSALLVGAVIFISPAGGWFLPVRHPSPVIRGLVDGAEQNLEAAELVAWIDEKRNELPAEEKWVYLVQQEYFEPADMDLNQAIFMQAKDLACLRLEWGNAFMDWGYIVSNREDKFIVTDDDYIMQAGPNVVAWRELRGSRVEPNPQGIDVVVLEWDDSVCDWRVREED
ncbi:hypothetical protein [Anaerohalosphaera lusitana]|nr:hypothetical protein [Anaerohalosphaera lusitana]